jgi:hypothetical protein
VAADGAADGDGAEHEEERAAGADEGDAGVEVNQIIDHLYNDYEIHRKEIFESVKKEDGNVILLQFTDEQKIEIINKGTCALQKPQQKQIVELIFKDYNYDINDNLDSDVITLLNEINFFPHVLSDGITGFANIKNKIIQFYESKIHKKYLENITDDIDELVNFFKREMNEVSNTEKGNSEEIKTIKSIFSKTGVLDFEFNKCYFLMFNVVKLHLFTIVLRKFIEKMKEDYTVQQYTDYFTSEKTKNNYASEPDDDVKKVFFLVNIKKNVVQSIFEMLNSSKEGENTGFNKEFFTELQECISTALGRMKSGSAWAVRSALSALSACVGPPLVCAAGSAMRSGRYISTSTHAGGANQTGRMPLVVLGSKDDRFFC